MAIVVDIDREIEETNNRLSELKRLKQEEENNRLKSLYGTQWSCDNCRYSIRQSFNDIHNCCTKHNCTLCFCKCNKFKPMNRLAEYLRSGQQFDNDDMYLCDALLDLPDEAYDDAVTYYELDRKLFPNGR